MVRIINASFEELSTDLAVDIEVEAGDQHRIIVPSAQTGSQESIMNYLAAWVANYNETKNLNAEEALPVTLEDLIGQEF